LLGRHAFGGPAFVHLLREAGGFGQMIFIGQRRERGNNQRALRRLQHAGIAIIRGAVQQHTWKGPRFAVIARSHRMHLTQTGTHATRIRLTRRAELALRPSATVDQPGSIFRLLEMTLVSMIFTGESSACANNGEEVRSKKETWINHDVSYYGSRKDVLHHLRRLHARRV